MAPASGSAPRTTITGVSDFVTTLLLTEPRTAEPMAFSSRDPTTIIVASRARSASSAAARPGTAQAVVGRSGVNSATCRAASCTTCSVA
jgi:hypothetical protein